MICIYCDNVFVEPFSIHQFFFHHKMTVCDNCLKQFEKLKGPICKLCGCVSKERYCDQCIEQLNLNSIQPIQSNRSIFHYNDEMKKWIYRYKFYGDVTLATMFITDLREYYEKYFGKFKIVPIPLSEERLKERGFNQVEVLAELAGLKLTRCLQRVHTEKQSKLNRHERIQREQIFSFCGEKKFENEPILVLDDVYTTGKTVRDAAIILLQNGACEVFSLTLIRA